MSNLEDFAINQLIDFVGTAKEMGICYGGCDIDPSLQVLIIDVVEEYIGDHLRKDEENKKNG